MIVVSILLHAEIEPKDHQEDATHFIYRFIIAKSNLVERQFALEVAATNLDVEDFHCPGTHLFLAVTPYDCC